MAVTIDDVRGGVRRLGLGGRPLCIHASLRSFGWVEGGAATVVTGLLAEGCTVLVPAFSWEAFAVDPLPDQQPAGNGADYVPAPLSNYGRKGATAFTAGGRQFGVTVDRDSDSVLSRSSVADGRRARHSVGHQGYLVRVLGTAEPPLGFDWHAHSNGSCVR